MTEPSFPIYRKDLKKYSPEFKLEAVVADGMWYSLTKWKKLAKVEEEDVAKFVADNLGRGKLIQSATGAKSFRYNYAAVVAWHQKYGLKPGDAIFDFIFPARVWDRQTEVDGFNRAPLREVGIITFECNNDVMLEVKAALVGIAKVRSSGPGHYKAYCLNAKYVKDIVQGVFDRHTIAEASRIYSRSSSWRRELSDFTPIFAEQLILFYRGFARSLLKKEMETVRIYLPDAADQNAQILEWVLTAIEKFNETSSVPFSGYLASVLRRWPYDLPNYFLGKDLSVFQRDRSKAIKALKEKFGGATLSNEQLAEEMGMRLADFLDLEEKHHLWIHTKNASALTWDDSGEEKQTINMQEVVEIPDEVESLRGDMTQAHHLSAAIVRAALNCRHFDDAFSIIAQMDAGEIDSDAIGSVSPDFIRDLGLALGV